VSNAIRQATPEDWTVVRTIRLRALADAPSAFASRLEDERDRPGSAWRERLASRTAATFLSFDDADAVGIAGVFLLPDDGTRSHLVSMWVAPERRGTGIGKAMIDRALGWSQDHGAMVVELWVTETNEPARELYLRCGFVATGQRQPLPSDPSIEEIQMQRATRQS
jgi:GNAT superfamily N-acetyltransferase